MIHILGGAFGRLSRTRIDLEDVGFLKSLVPAEVVYRRQRCNSQDAYILATLTRTQATKQW